MNKTFIIIVYSCAFIANAVAAFVNQSPLYGFASGLWLALILMEVVGQ